MKHWLFPAADDLPTSPWLRVLAASAFGLLTGIATAALDVSWQHGLTPAWLDQATLPIARILGVWVEPETDALVVVPAFSGLILLLVLAWRALRPGQQGPLRAAAVTARSLFPAVACVALILGNWLWLGYIEWWTLSPKELMSGSVVVVAPIMWIWFYSRGRIEGGGRAAASLCCTLAGAALLFGLVWNWDDARVYVGLPSMYHLRFELPKRTLSMWLALLCVGPGLVLSALAELSHARGAKKRVVLTLIAAAGLLCWPAARNVLEPYGVFRTFDTEPGEEHTLDHARQSALLLASGRKGQVRERSGEPETVLRERLHWVTANGMFDLHRLKRSQLARWERLPGVDGALVRLGRLRPRRRGWWGTGPAGLPRLPVHPGFSERARVLADLLVDNPEVAEWHRRCSEVQGGGELQGRVLAPVPGPLRVRLFQQLGPEAGDDLVRRAMHELDREATFWGWTALLVTDADPEGNFHFKDLPAGDYLVAVLLPGSGWRAPTSAPGVITLGPGESRRLDAVELRAPISRP